MNQRLSIAETWDSLDADGFEMPRDESGAPILPAAMPNFDDEEEAGFSVHKGGWPDGCDLANLSLPRSYFGRSLFQGVDFQNTDLSGSRMCWNDFVDCDFSAADLTGADLRASLFQRCRFTGATLAGADLRHSCFEDCDFTGAGMSGCVAEAAQRASLRPTQEQAAGIDWRSEPGPKPPGG